MTSEMQAVLKARYGSFIDPMPNDDTMAKFATFVKGEQKSGRSYNFTIYLGLPHGVTHNDDHTAFTLSSVIAPVSAEATLNGSEILIADNVAYADMFATSNGTGDGNSGGAYMSARDYKVLGLMKSGELYRELALLYGPGPTSTAASNLGVVNASVSGASLTGGQVVNITRASFIPGLWPLMNNAIVDIYQSDATTLRASGVTVTAPSESNCRITVTKSGSGAVVAAGDILLARGAIDVSCYGLEAICSNSGSIFGISASTYPQWKVGSYSAGSAAMERIDVLSVGSRVHNKGIRNGGTLFVSAPTFTDLSEEAAELLRTAPDSNDVVTQGATKLVYRTAAGPITVQSYMFMKQGTAMFFPTGIVKRVGSTDLTYRDPFSNDDWFLQQLSTSAGVQMRIYSDQAIVVEQPWHGMYVTSIVNTADQVPA